MFSNSTCAPQEAGNVFRIKNTPIILSHLYETAINMEEINKNLINVLLIEDNPGDARLIREHLSEAKDILFHLELVDRLSKGLERLSQEGIDVILLDLSLPDSRGFETLRKVKDEGSQAPIIVLTGLDDEKLALRAVREGAQDYLVKGQVDGNLLVRSIRYAIERKRVAEALRESEEKFKSLAEESPNMIFINRNGKVVYANKKCEEIMGYRREEIYSPDFDFLTLIAPESVNVVKENFKKHLRRENVPPTDYILVTRDGKKVKAIYSTKLISYEGETAILGIVTDITESKKAEEKLRESEEKFRLIFENAKDAIFWADPETGLIINCNKAGEVLLEKERKEIIGSCQTTLHPPQKAEYYSNMFKSHIEKKGAVDNNAEVMTKTGTIKLVHITASITFVGGKPIIQGIFRDITERKQAEEALRESEEKYRNLIDNSQDAIYLLYNGRFEIINKKFEELFGYVQKETNAPSFNFMKLVAPQSRSLIQERVEKVEKGEPVLPRYEFTALSRDGKEIEVETSVSYIQYKGGIGTQGILRDISERKRAEEALKKRATRLGLIAHVGQKTTAILEPDELLHQAVKLIGDTFNYYNVIILLMENDELVLRASTLPSLQPLEGQIRLRIGSEGITGWVAESGEPLLVPDVSEDRRYFTSLEKMETQSEMAVPIVSKGTVIGVLDAQSAKRDDFTQDEVFTLQTLADQLAIAIENARLYEQAEKEISDRRQMEESLRVERDKLKNILDNMNDQVVIEDENFNIIYQNKKSMQIVGSKVGSKCYEAFRNRKQSCDEGFCAVRHVLKENGDGPFFYNSEAGEGLSWEAVALPIMNEKGERVVLEIVRDITDRKQLQEQLIQSEKMSALGQLISGVAHELNNPLTGILGFSQLLLMSSNLPEATRHSLETINHEAERARKIVQNLLTFARQRKTTKKKIQINEIVGRTIDLRAYEMRVNNIEIIKRFNSQCPPILADDHQLQQVFMNLIINAEQAMIEAHGKGRFEVTTVWDKENKVVRISFEDDGPGIAEEHMPKIFDPFFTTKPVGKGTGLGLSISYSIVQDHGGCIRAHSENGCGTTFTIELPICEVETSNCESPALHHKERSHRVTGKILVVDDESSVVELVKDALEGVGHTVEVAYDGDSALEKIEENNIEAVVTDLKMPGRSGIDMYFYCKKHRPELARRFLFLTGDVGTARTLQFMEEQKVPYVSKPFYVKDLVSSVAHLFKEEG